jgi:hypothetical protein
VRLPERRSRKDRTPAEASREEARPMSRRAGGRAARQAARLQAVVESVPFLTRTLAPVEVVSDEGLALLEENADTILEQVGIEFRDTPDAITLLRDAGAEIDGERVRFPRGLARQLVQATAPASSPSSRGTPSTASSSAAPTRFSRPRTARPSSATSTRGAGTGRSRTSGTSCASRTRRHGFTIPAERSASPSTCRSTSATTTWSRPTSLSATSRSWAR